MFIRRNTEGFREENKVQEWADDLFTGTEGQGVLGEATQAPGDWVERDTQQSRATGARKGGEPEAGLPSGWELSATPGSCFSLPFLEAP